LIMMLSISWTMTLVSLIILPISAIAVSMIIKKSQKYFKAQQDYLGHVNGQVEEVYGGHNIVKVFNGEEKAIHEFTKMNEELYHSGWKSQFMSGLMHPIMMFTGNVGYVGVAILGGYLAVQGRITVGNIQSFIQYNKQFTQPIGQVAQISSTIQSMIAAAERIFEFLEENEEFLELVSKELETTKEELFYMQKLFLEYYDTEKGKQFLKKLENICQNHNCIIVDTFDEIPYETEKLAEQKGLSKEQVRFAIAKCHGKIVKYLIKKGIDYTIFMTGGDTLMGLMKNLENTELTPVCEISQGVVLSILKWNEKKLQVVSKSGGFGNKDVFIEAAKKLIQY